MTAAAGPVAAAPVTGGPDGWTGIAIAEDIRDIDAAIRSGSWVDGALAGAGGALDGLAAVVDPIGSLGQSGVSWLIEHVEPLTEALDWLAGDVTAISAHARTWTEVSTTLTAEAEGLDRAAHSDLTGWTGEAAEAYRGWAGRREAELRALGDAADTVAAMSEGAGGLVGAVRLMVRDAIAAVVGRLLVYAAEVIATRGLALPLVVGQVTALCATWAARISRWLKSLIDSLRGLVAHGDRIQDLIRSLGRKAGTNGATRPGVGGTDSEPPRAGGAGPGASQEGGAGEEQTGAGGDGADTGGANGDGAGRRDGSGSLDAGRERGPLGDGFRSGVEDPGNLFAGKERAIADLLAAEGRMVHPRRRVEDVTGLTNPDAMVRDGPDDPGVVTEFKTPESASSSSMRSNILAAGKQLSPHGGGDVVIDGRAAGLTEEVARHGWARAAGQAAVHGSALPDRVRVILADGTMLELP